ncbi:MAG: site-specific DNA-methyltransferase [Epulopiscium sp.]|nr:site-specific DNA-methyltransferase [Candidatus Epulonipiscium sp.]
MKCTDEVLFKDVEVNITDIDQALLNIDNKVRSNLFSWNGQFSPQFIEVMLNQYAEEGYRLYDPFVGSGTTLYECSRMGIEGIGMELNPSAYYMAKIYELSKFSIKDREDIIAKTQDIIDDISNEDMIIETIVNEIKSNNNTKNILSLLIILMDIYKNKVTFKLLNDKWNNLKEIIMKIPFSEKEMKVILGDSRYSEIEGNSVDLVLTSPPYINVFNYHQNYRRSVEVLGYDVLKIARKELGSNRKNRGNRFLTVVEYCIDMSLTIRDMIRVGKEKSRFILVVGRESNVLTLSFSNSELIYNICNDIFGLDFVIRQERVFKNRFGRMIYEDILHFKNNKINYNSLSEEEIINKSRNIAKNMLKQKLKMVDDEYKNYELLVAAIDRADKVNKSEV